MAIVHVVVDRHDLDGRDIEAGQVLDGRLGRQAGIGALQLVGNTGQALAEALDMQFVDERLVPGSAWRTVIAPGEGRIDYGSQGRESRVVALVERQVGRR